MYKLTLESTKKGTKKLILLLYNYKIGNKDDNGI